MKKTLLIGILFFALSFSVLAYPFINYGHNAFWNDSAEVGTASGNGWYDHGGTATSYSTFWFANGSKSILLGWSGSAQGGNNLTEVVFPSNGDYNFTFVLWINTTPSATQSLFGISNRTTADFNGCGEGTINNVCIGWTVASNTNWTVFSDTSNVSTIPLTTGNHSIQMEVRGFKNVSVYVDGQIIGRAYNRNHLAHLSYYQLIGNTPKLYIDDLHLWNGTSSNPGEITLQVQNIVNSTVLGGFCANFTSVTNSTVYTHNSLLNESASRIAGCSSGNNSDCYEELLNSMYSNRNVTRVIGGNLSVPWMDSSSSCTQSNLQSGGNCNIGTVNFSQYCMVSDELSLVGLEIAMGRNQSRFEQYRNTIKAIRSAFGQIPSWKVLVNETSGSFLPCDSRTNNNCDTASDATARIIMSLFIAANNTHLSNANQSSYLALALNMTRDMVQYEIKNQCYNSTMGNGPICYWPGGGANVTANGFSATDFAYSAYFADIAQALLIAGQYNSTYTVIASNVTQAYLHTAQFNGTKFRVPPGRSFRYDNITGGNTTPFAVCTNTCSPVQWDSVDAPRAFGMGEVDYLAKQRGIIFSNLSQYLAAWSSEYLLTNNNSVVLQYYPNGTNSSTVQSGYFAQGLQSQAVLTNSTSFYNQTLANALGHYDSSPKTWDFTTCFGIYQEGPAIRSYGLGIGRILSAIGISANAPATIFSVSTVTSCTANSTIAQSLSANTYNITAYNINGTGSGKNHFDVTQYNYFYDGSSAPFITLLTYQALLNINSYRLYANTSITTFNVTNGQAQNTTSTTNLYVPANNGSNNIKVDVPGNYTKNFSLTVTTPLTTNNYNATGIYDNLFTIMAISRTNNSPVSLFTIKLNNNSFGGDLYQQTTTNGSLTIPTIQNYYYLFSLNASGFANTNITLPANDTTNAYNFSLYTSNSLNITFYDEETRAIINYTSVYLELISNPQSRNFTTTNGGLLIELLAPADYTLRYTALGYLTRLYQFSIVDGSFNYLNLTLLNTSSGTNVTVTVYDDIGRVVENATVKVLKYDIFTNNYIVNQIVKTNFEGKNVINVEANNEYYKFIIEYGGAPVLVTTPTYIFGTTLTFRINTGTSGLERIFTNQGLSGNISFSNATSLAAFTYNDVSNTATQGCLYAYQISGSSQTLYNVSCANTPAGSILMTLPQLNSTSYILKGQIIIAGLNETVNTYYISYKTTIPDSGKRTGLFVLLLLLFVCAMIASYNIEASIVLAGLAILLTSIIGITAISINAAIPIFLFCIFMAFVVGWKS